MTDTESDAESIPEERYCHDEYFSSVQDTIEYLSNKSHCDVLRYVDINKVIDVVDSYILSPDRKHSALNRDLDQEELSCYAVLIRVIMDNPSYNLTEEDLYYVRDTLEKLIY